MVKIDTQSSLPIHAQVVNGFKNLILCNLLKENDKLPSVRALASELVVNPNTIHKAYKILEDEGYVLSQAGKGMYVKAMTKDKTNYFLKTLEEKFTQDVKKLISLGTKKEKLISIIEKIEEDIC
ncbi:MAG: GntR family transcriptional regulator [Lachnospirales bacterium]